MKPPVSDQLSLGVVFVAALGGAFGVGAWQGYHTPRGPTPVDAPAPPSTFVQSGDRVTAEPALSVPDAAGALTQARPPAAPGAAASAF